MGKCKLLIMDKSIFQGKNPDKLNDFVRCHNVLLPYTLMFECIISQPEKGKEAKDPRKLLTKLINCVKSGARVSKSPVDILEEEKSKNAPIDSIIDEEETKIIRTNELDESCIEQTAKICEETFEPTIDLALQTAKKCYEEIRKRGMMKYSNEERLKKLLQAIDIYHEQQSIPEKSFSKNDGWTWQIFRLFSAWLHELAFKSGMNLDNMDISKISNDIHDIYYVAYLSKADGLLTADKNLVQPLAEAAFPEKDVFCNMGEVSSAYIICNWR